MRIKQGVKGRWLRKIRRVGKATVIERQPGIAAIEIYLKSERVVFL